MDCLRLYKPEIVGTDRKESSLHLSQMMIRKYPSDIVYYNILGEAHLKNGNHLEAVRLFDDVVFRDETNRNINALNDILHRASCTECFKPIRGIRVKCANASCGYCDRCIRCFPGPI